MTKMEKFALVAALLENLMVGYFKYVACKAITKEANLYFTKEAQRVVARQRQKFYKNVAESGKET